MVHIKAQLIDNGAHEKKAEEQFHFKCAVEDSGTNLADIHIVMRGPNKT
jgi:hypothetical protein